MPIKSQDMHASTQKIVMRARSQPSFSEEILSSIQSSDAALQQTSYFLPAVSQGIYVSTSIVK